MTTTRLETETLGSDDAGIARAADLLCVGRLVAFPTETVYGLGADARNGAAVAGIYAAKGRPSFNPLIAHVADLDAALAEADFEPVALALAKAFWPGPMTLVLPRRAGSKISDLVTAGLSTLALRIPDHHLARALISATGTPIAAPSANRSGHVSPTTANHVLADLSGRIDAVVDGGPTSVGVESTILQVVDGRVSLLRPGGLSRGAVEAVIGGRVETASAGDPSAPLAPGMLASHYAPRARLRLNATVVRPGEALLAFGAPLARDPAAPMLNLSPASNLIEAAANLFGMLRALDGTGVTHIAAMPVPEHGLGEAINDRLLRAAAER